MTLSRVVSSGGHTAGKNDCVFVCHVWRHVHIIRSLLYVLYVLCFVEIPW